MSRFSSTFLISLSGIRKPESFLTFVKIIPRLHDCILSNTKMLLKVDGEEEKQQF